METAEALREEARALERSARFHKRQSAAHRRRAREDRAKLAQVRKRCESLGITLELVQDEGQEVKVNGAADTRSLDARS
jgi:hypothetical protein